MNQSEHIDKKYPGEKLLIHNKRIIRGYVDMSNEFTKEDRELLIRVDERSERVERWCYNHDSQHFRYNLLAWSVALGAIITLAICVTKLV